MSDFDHQRYQTRCNPVESHCKLLAAQFATGLREKDTQLTSANVANMTGTQKQVQCNTSAAAGRPSILTI